MKNVGMAVSGCVIGFGIGAAIGTQNFSWSSAFAQQPLKKTHRASTLTRAPCTIQIFDTTLHDLGNSSCSEDLATSLYGPIPVDLTNSGNPSYIASLYWVADCIPDCRGLRLGLATGPVEHDPPLVPTTIDGGGPTGSPVDYESFLGEPPTRIVCTGYFDFDQDGRLDMRLWIRGSVGTTGRSAWLRNIYDGPARLPADLNDDGRVDGADLGELFVQWTG